MTRLRFQLFDMKKADIAKIEQLEGVMGVKEDKEKQKFSAKLLDMISGIFAPVIPLSDCQLSYFLMHLPYCQLF